VASFERRWRRPAASSRTRGHRRGKLAPRLVNADIWKRRMEKASPIPARPLPDAVQRRTPLPRDSPSSPTYAFARPRTTRTTPLACAPGALRRPADRPHADGDRPRLHRPKAVLTATRGRSRLHRDDPAKSDFYAPSSIPACCRRRPQADRGGKKAIAEGIVPATKFSTSTAPSTAARAGDDRRLRFAGRKASTPPDREFHHSHLTPRRSQDRPREVERITGRCTR